MSAVHSEITTSFLRNLLKNYDDVKNLQYSVTPLPAGENFTSDLYQITINYEGPNNTSTDTSLMLKCLSDNEVLSDYAKTLSLFDNEIDMYRRILPKIYSLEYIKNVSAKALYASLTPKPILILEDLTKRGYKMQCRYKGLDLDHCLLVIEKLAYLHVSSIVISKKETLSNFNLDTYWTNSNTTGWITIGLEALIETCTKFNNLNRYAAKLQSIQENFFEKAFEFTKNKIICNVLNHGDCWVNNLMFLYNQDGGVKDVVFVDFQECHYSSPVVDLHYFCATSANSDVLTDHLSEILDYYCNQFFNNVQKLKVIENVPNKVEIEADFKRVAIYGLSTLITSTPIVKSTKRPDATIENYFKFSGEGSFRYDCYNNERYVDRITHLLPFYDRLGVFD